MQSIGDTMSCKSCGGGSNRHNQTQSPVTDLKKFAYLSPRQLRYLKSLEEPAPQPEETVSQEPEEKQD